MATYAQLKQDTANYTAKNDYGTSSGNEIREHMINVAIRAIYNAHKWKMTWATSSEDLTMSSGAADLDSSYNPLFGLSRCTDENNNDYTEINPADQGDYTNTDDYVYWIDYNTSTECYRVNTPSTATTLSVIYNIVSTDLSDDADVCLIPDREAIAYYAAAKTWLAKERDEKNHDRYMTLYKEKLEELIEIDNKYTFKRRIKSLGERHDMGYNTRDL
jgi:hypothetical protein